MIHHDFFKLGKSYKSAGKLARNVLKRDYEKFLYERGLERKFDVLELEKKAKEVEGLK